MENNELRKKAIVDANINRVSEGLRVVEDWARFFLRDKKLTDDVRNIRHGLWGVVSENYPDIIKGRDTGDDILAEAVEGRRSDLKDIPKASFNRVKEGFRVLEEMSKLISKEAGSSFKKMRFKLYEIEKEFYGSRFQEAGLKKSHGRAG